MERIYPYVFVLGLVLAIVGFIWLVVAGFRTRWGWGLGSLLLPPFSLIFGITHWQRAKMPFMLLIGGLFLTAAPTIITKLMPVDLGPYEKRVNEEVHLTLTGWDQRDYSVLDQRSDVVVLQMANADVTDDTLKHLKSMNMLRELDLSGSQVTDAGLEHLKGMSKLETLRLRDTQVTDAGFQKVLGMLPALRRIDLTGTRVSRETTAEWKKAGMGRIAMP
jgi:hypothetical protein